MSIQGPDHEQAKREHKAFMSNSAQVAEFSQASMRDGFFVALEQARIKGSVGPAYFRYKYRKNYQMMLERVVEAQKETAHIASAVRRLETTARQGMHRMHHQTLYELPDDDHFQRDLLAFQGWLASLMETYISLFMFIEGSRGATRKLAELNAALNAIIQRNVADGSVRTGNSDAMRAMTEL